MRFLVLEREEKIGSVLRKIRREDGLQPGAGGPGLTLGGSGSARSIERIVGHDIISVLEKEVPAHFFGRESGAPRGQAHQRASGGEDDVGLRRTVRRRRRRRVEPAKSKRPATAWCRAQLRNMPIYSRLSFTLSSGL